MEPARDNPHALQSLLLLKRREVPPPGFFDRLPESIRAELQRGVARPRGLAARWQILRSGWRLEPALSAAMLLAVAGIYGIALLGPEAPEADPATAALPLVAQPHRQTGLTVVDPTQWLAELQPDDANTGGSLAPRSPSAPPPWLFTPGAGVHSVQVGFHPGSDGFVTPRATHPASNDVIQPKTGGPALP